MPPHFDQAGISILLRRKQPEMNTIKFSWITFKPGVWLLLLLAIFLIGGFIWVLEKFSPYSYYNNRPVVYVDRAISICHDYLI